ncbi:GntR family transcriptional regulator [Sphingobium sufflavum]|uniref:GntR family transcriptional regulator n=1 Tax=Sphingobium sufflavum TaxID=1129547 RepID=UPI001F3C6687|nr:GntR family transcriptional regulator [Sphingobium sufflavum]MCE7798028.1 GntR family transcriptional regulator [Sphingobium sufflavum]
MKQNEQSGVASERVADIVAERILAGQLKPGTRIKQDELATELNISRIPVRDGLRILATRGLISFKPNLGARVSAVTVRDMEMSYRIREQLEPMLLAESIPNLTDMDIEEMRDVLTQLVEVDDVEAFLPLDRQFHWIAYRGHEVPQLAQIVERLWDTTQSYRRAYAKLALTNGGKVMRAEHQMIFSAIERREVEMAQAALVLHIRRTRVGLANYGYLIGAEPVIRTSAF